MIEKEKLLKRLDNAIGLEEKGTNILASGIKKRLEGADISFEEKSRLNEILDIIKRDSVWHTNAFRSMADQVREDSRYGF